MNSRDLVVVNNVSLPSDWDYDKSVEKTKENLVTWKSLTIEILTELKIAREKLSQKGGYQFHKEVRGTKVPSTKTWSDYCIDIGHSRQVVNRWLDRDKKRLDKPKDYPEDPKCIQDYDMAQNYLDQFRHFRCDADYILGIGEKYRFEVIEALKYHCDLVNSVLVKLTKQDVNIYAKV